MLLRMFRRLQTIGESGTASLAGLLSDIGIRESCVLEWCYYLHMQRALTAEELATLTYCLSESFDPLGFGEQSMLATATTVVEVGPRLNFATPWSSSALEILHHCGLTSVDRIERSLRIGLPSEETWVRDKIVGLICDEMTQLVYDQPLTSFDTGLTKARTETIPLIEGGIEVLREINVDLGLAMDEATIGRVYALFVETLQRNPTDVELFQIGQMDNEHCRHPFFRWPLVVDGVRLEKSLMDIIREPHRLSPRNSKIAFEDDSSAIQGPEIEVFLPEDPTRPSRYVTDHRTMHPTQTAETHNHPVRVSPYAGAATGPGGESRDLFSPGQGAYIGSNGVGYAVGGLWHPQGSFFGSAGRESVRPLHTLIEASNGASDYNNCLALPGIYGFLRCFEMQLPDGYRGWLKPILYAVGTGLIDDDHITAGATERGMLVVLLGGPSYRIGVGGGSASTLIAGENSAQLDFASVQRGDPEMGHRLYSVVRACVELGAKNPIVTIHDLGAGGNSNAIPEIVNPAGAEIYLDALPVADPTLSAMEIWGNESQERAVVLIDPDNQALLYGLCARENLPCATVGVITEDGQFQLTQPDSDPLVDMPMDAMLTSTPAPDNVLTSVPVVREPLVLPPALTFDDALMRVLGDPAVGSKAMFTNKGDRSVTGTIVQQQCVGPYHLPLADCAVQAHSLSDLPGTAKSLGEQPIKMLVNPEAGARMALVEGILNLVGAVITNIADIRMACNWMWAAKLEGEGALLYRAAVAVTQAQIELGMATDGGKDSLTMAVKLLAELIKAPGEMVMALYAAMMDASRCVTPELKASGNRLILLDLSDGQARMGGSILAQTFDQIGDVCPDANDMTLVGRLFGAVQNLVENGLIVSCHDVSDGGLATTLAEMAIGSQYGLSVSVDSRHSAIERFFAEEAGLVIEVAGDDFAEVARRLSADKVPFVTLGHVTTEPTVRIVHNGDVVLEESTATVRAWWDYTAWQIERLQMNPDCANTERSLLESGLVVPDWQLSFTPRTKLAGDSNGPRPRVAILREQGTNGHRELAHCFREAGFDAWDVTMTDLRQERISLDQFQGIGWPGGFSYGDVLDAGKGWAAQVRTNPRLRAEFDRFYRRDNTFSFGPCNGAQVMALLGWVSQPDLADVDLPRFIENTSGRFESRFVTLRIEDSPAIMLRGMAGTRLGCWVAHQQGRARYSEEPGSAIPMRYVTPDSGEPTMQYPYNPNGSYQAVAAYCSPDGRHLAMMPHIERLPDVRSWPWLPENLRGLNDSPWMEAFANAYDWSIANQ